MFILLVDHKDLIFECGTHKQALVFSSCRKFKVSEPAYILIVYYIQYRPNGWSVQTYSRIYLRLIQSLFQMFIQMKIIFHLRTDTLLDIRRSQGECIRALEDCFRLLRLCWNKKNCIYYSFRLVSPCIRWVIAWFRIFSNNSEF